MSDFKSDAVLVLRYFTFAILSRKGPPTLITLWMVAIDINRFVDGEFVVVVNPISTVWQHY